MKNICTRALIPVFCFALLCLAAPARSAPAGLTLKADVDRSQSRPVSPSLGGVSLVLTYADQWAGLSEEDEIARYAPKMLRFPAGTHAMFFDWETGRYSGKPINPKRRLSGYSVDKFFELAKRYGSEVSYIVNIYQDPPEKTGRLARYLASKGYRVRYWELGNEPYAGIYADKFNNAGAYLDVARAHAAQIRKVFPDAEFGVAADPRTRHVNFWNLTLCAQQDFRNIIVHKYFGPVREKRESMIAQSVQPDTEKAYGDMLEASVPAEPNFVGRFPGKRFWVTEWGLLFIGFDIEDSMAHAIWMGRTFINMAGTPSIDMAAYWNLNASPFELIEPLNGGFIRRVPLYVFQMINSQLDGAERTMPVTFSSGERVSRDVAGQFFEGSRGEASVLIVNSGAAEYRLEFPGMADKKLTVEVISSDDVMGTNGYSKAFTLSFRKVTSETITPVRKVIDGKSFNLPGHSVASVYFGG